MESYKANHKYLKNTLAAAINESTQLCPLLDDIREDVVDLFERLVVKNSATRSIVEDSYALLRLFFRGLVKNFRVGLNRSVNEAICMGSIGY